MSHTEDNFFFFIIMTFTAIATKRSLFRVIRFFYYKKSDVAHMQLDKPYLLNGNLSSTQEQISPLSKERAAFWQITYNFRNRRSYSIGSIIVKLFRKIFNVTPFRRVNEVHATNQLSLKKMIRERLSYYLRTKLT